MTDHAVAPRAAVAGPGPGAFTDHVRFRWWRTTLGTLLAAGALWMGIAHWYADNSYAHISQSSTALSLPVQATDPVTVTPPGDAPAAVRGAPADLRAGDTLSVYVDPSAPDVVYYAGSAAGATQAARGAGSLLAGAAAAWLLAMLMWTRLPGRRVVRAAASGPGAPACVLTDEPDATPGLLRQLTRAATRTVTLDRADMTDPVPVHLTGRRPLPVGALVWAQGEGHATTVTTRDDVWWPAPGTVSC